MEGGHLTLPSAVLSTGAPLLESDVGSENIFPSKCGQSPPCPSRIKKQWPQPSFNHLINTFETQLFHVFHSGFRAEGMDCTDISKTQKFKEIYIYILL